MRLVIAFALCLSTFGAQAHDNRHHIHFIHHSRRYRARSSHKRVIHYATRDCIETGNIMHPCKDGTGGTFRLMQAARRTERRGQQLIDYAPAYQPNEQNWLYGAARQVKRVLHRAAIIIGGRPRGCPHAYCGCFASLEVFGRIIPRLNLAANWERFPRAVPAPGMIAVKNHHVFVIKSVNSDGTVIAEDGNSGHGLSRIHTMSLRGYEVVNPHGV